MGEIVKKQNGSGSIQDLIHKMKSQFALALPKHITPDRFMRVALTAVNKNPKLLACTKETLLACLMDCSQLGIEPDGRKAHLIPYGNSCTLIIDYKGLVDLARRSGEIADIHADVVCENDDFEYSYGDGSRLVHKPNLKGRGPVIGAYSYCRLKDGTSSYEVMSIEEVDAIRQRSKASKSGPWVTDWNEMAKKTVFRRHAKWLPLSADFQEAIDKDFDVPADITNDTVQLVQDIEMPRAINAPKKETVKKEEVSSYVEEVPVRNDDEIDPDMSAEDFLEEHYQDENGDKVDIKQCSQCGSKMTEKVIKFSKDKFGIALCYSCQKKVS